MANTDWAEWEVRLIVADYLSMLASELRRETYSKTAHRRGLLRQLRGRRSEPSIEFKHRNISHVLCQMGLPYIEGYKPAANVQGLLETVVASHLEHNPDMVTEMAVQSAQVPDLLPTSVAPFESVVVDPPTANEHLMPEARRIARPVTIDFAERDAANRRLGRMGEEWVVNLERKRLSEQGRNDLVRHVEWVSDTRGDGMGFDILSRNFDGTDRFIEVKTTNLHAAFPFVVTRNEVLCSNRAGDLYHLYRVFHFNRNARLFILPGALDRTATLEPLLYRASLRTT